MIISKINPQILSGTFLQIEKEIILEILSNFLSKLNSEGEFLPCDLSGIPTEISQDLYRKLHQQIFRK